MANKQRMIDADVLVRDINADPYRTESEKSYDRCLVHRQPTIEAAPVVHGRWDNECRCTVCGWYGEDWYKRDVYYFDYCPKCSAKMDGGVSDG